METNIFSNLWSIATTLVGAAVESTTETTTEAVKYIDGKVVELKDAVDQKFGK